MSEEQQKMSDIINEIIDTENEDLEEYYGTFQCMYKDIDKYLERLDDIKDKIFLAQWCKNSPKVKELIAILSLTEYERNKYLELKSKNRELDETINFKILSEKYSFLDNMLDMITIDPDIQYQIVTMPDERLKLFEKLYKRLQKLTNYYNPYLAKILRRLSYVAMDTAWQNKFHIYDDLLKDIDNLIKNGYELREKDIDTLLYLCTTTIHHTIPSFNEMFRFGDSTTKDSIEFKKIVEKAKRDYDIENLKFAILAVAYGIHIVEAREICRKYNLESIKITPENKDVFEMYQAIYQIVNEIDPKVLSELYDEFTKIMTPKKDFRRIIVFENDLRATFAHDLHSEVYKTTDEPYIEIDGIKVYDAPLNFKMIVTAIGAYKSNFKNQDNYSDYWNSPKIRSHGNCCSLIGNDNLSMATVKNVIFGFSTMNDNMLLLCGSSDINSTPNSRNFDTTDNRSVEYMNASKLLDNTRGDYNELVYERRDLSSNPKFYKKNPDYIVFIEEYEDFDVLFERFKDDSKKTEYLQKQKEDQDKKWQETVKAARDFNIPVVKINREKLAKNEFSKIVGLVDEFKRTHNPKLLGEFITKFENNRVGNAGLHAPLRERYFSAKKMSAFLSDIKNTINEEKDPNVRNNLYFSLYNSIIEEQRKVIACKYGKRNKKQTSGINLKEELKELEAILKSNNINHRIGRKL